MSHCAPGRSAAGTPADKKSRPQTLPSETSSEKGSAGSNGKEQNSATTPESASPHKACSYACKWPSALLSCAVQLSVSAFHRLQENIFERVAPEVHPPDAHLALRGETKNVARLNPIRQNHLHPVRRDRTLTAKLLDRCGKIAVGAVDPVGLQLEKPFVRAPLFIQIRVMSDSPLFQNQNLVAGVFNIAQQMRAQNNPHFLAIPNLADHANHALPRRRIQAIGGLIKD